MAHYFTKLSTSLTFCPNDCSEANIPTDRQFIFWRHKITVHQHYTKDEKIAVSIMLTISRIKSTDCSSYSIHVSRFDPYCLRY